MEKSKCERGPVMSDSRTENCESTATSGADVEPTMNDPCFRNEDEILTSLQKKRMAWLLRQHYAGRPVTHEQKELLGPQLCAVFTRIEDEALDEDEIDNCFQTDWEASEIVAALHGCKVDDPDPFARLTMRDVVKQVQSVRWLWPQWVPYGMLTLLVADPGKGKSALALGSLARAVVQSTPFLDGSPGLASPHNVLLIDNESAQQMNAQRITSWRIPPERICLLSDDIFTGIDLDLDRDLIALRMRIIEERAPLVLIDSLGTAHHGDENSAAMGHCMRRLAEVAAETGAAIVVVHHTNKYAFGEEADIESVRGSGAILAMSRSVLILDKPDLESDVVRLRSVKSNLGPIPDPVGFRISNDGIVAASVPETADESVKLTKVERAGKFLADFLGGGARPASLVYKVGEESGFPKRTIERAKDAIGIISERAADHWEWRLPDKESQEDRAEITGDVGDVGDL